MQQYFLNPHVHLCVTEDHVVLLDLQRDKYIGIGPGQMEALAAQIKGWPAGSRGQAGEPVRPEPGTPAKSPLTKMIDSGMLTTDPAVGKDARPLVLPQPETTLTEADLESRPDPTAGQIAGFIGASIVARLSLRWRPIQSVVTHVQRRKHRRAGAVDLAKARELVEAFLYLRPLLFGARDECLYDSLALIEFLARHGVFPTWVFGVQTRPFLAHSWVQHEGIVFNDTPDYVHRFTPIMAI